MDTVVRATPRAAQAEDWSLALTAMGVAHRVARGEDAGFVVLVAADEAARARQTLDAFDEDERARRTDALPAPALDPTPWEPGLSIGLFCLAAFALTGGPGADGPWFERGTAVAGLVRGAEPWRAVTALTLHVDAAHVAGNAVALALLVPAIAQRCGSGLAVALVLLGGIGGNWLAALAHAPAHRAVGASTAGFAAIGALAALRLLPAGHRRGRRWRAWTVPVAGVLLLTLLGAGRDVDVLAHGAGLLAGAGAGMVAALLPRPGRRAQRVLGALAVLTVALGWGLALENGG